MPPPALPSVTSHQRLREVVQTAAGGRTRGTQVEQASTVPVQHKDPGRTTAAVAKAVTAAVSIVPADKCRTEAHNEVQHKSLLEPLIGVTDL